MATTEPAPQIRGGSPVLALLLSLAMSAGTFALIALGVLATFLIDDLGISRGQLGLVLGADTLLAGLAAPFVGRMVDRLGGKRALIMVLLAAAVGWLMYAAAPIYAWLFLGVLFTGLADSSCNPATNRLIAETLPAGQRGVITGIKQSGVQMGTFIGGLILPSMAVAFGWRSSLAVVAVVPVAAALATWRLVDAPHRPPVDRRLAGDGRLPVAIRWLAGYGFLFGVAGAASLLIPLYVEESLGYDARIGGFVAAGIGLIGVVGRIWWARLSERLGRYVELLGAMTPLAVLAGVAFLLARQTAVMMWVGAVLIGVSTVSWNGVGMLAAINEGGSAASGKASGVVVFGFLLGLGLGPPVYGAIVDWTGSYAPMWGLSIGASVAAGILVLAWLHWSSPAGPR